MVVVAGGFKILEGWVGVVVLDAELVFCGVGT